MNTSQLVRRFHRLAASALTSLCICCMPPAGAQEIDIGAAAHYAAFIFGDVSGMSRVDGRLAAGGDLDTVNILIGARLPADASSAPSLVVGHDIVRLDRASIWANGGRISHGLYGGEKNSRAGYGVDLRKDPSAIDFASEALLLSVTSYQLAEVIATGKARLQGATLILEGSGAEADVFDLSADQVARGKTVKLQNIRAGAYLVINVRSDRYRRVSFGMKLDALKGRQQRVVFNFPDADVLTIDDTQVQGSVLAPQACIQGSRGRIEGNVVAASWKGTIEVGYAPFDTTP